MPVTRKVGAKKIKVTKVNNGPQKQPNGQSTVNALKADNQFGKIG